jgi:serine protease AprX
MTRETAVPAAGGLRLSVRFAAAARVMAVALAFAVSASFAAQPISWGERTSTAKTDPGLITAARHHPASTLRVIVRETVPTSSTAEDLVRSVGGAVTRQLGIIGSFSAQVPAASLGRLSASPAVWKVWGDARLQSEGYGIGKYDDIPANSVWKSTVKLGPAQNSYLGDGVGVALIDTGVVPTPGIRDRVVALVDLTGEGDGMDRFGHGTHLAGLILGDPTGATNPLYGGVAPHANLVSVKVAGYDGATDVSVVVAGLQWVVKHKSDYNIRVLNLSFGTDSRQPYSVDPLDYAVEQAWFKGIFVVVSAGNMGLDDGPVTKPGDDPFVMTVGAADLMGTSTQNDDAVADFSSRGPTQDGFSKPDIVAPGISMLSDRDVNSVIDQQHPLAVVDQTYFKGSGTSQAAAVVSGTAALMAQAWKAMTPDQAKAALMGTADKAITTDPATGLPADGSGAGLLNVDAAVGAAKGMKYEKLPANKGLVKSSGTGSLELSRGSAHVYVQQNGAPEPTVLTGEVDALGQTDTWQPKNWGANGWGANGWGANGWGANGWGANAWAGWGADAWGGMAWSANAWGANGWGANAWGANAWGANGWGANAWGANAWGANAWGANGWGANAWG